MANWELIEQHIQKMEEALAHLAKYQQISFQEFERDLSLVLWNLQNIFVNTRKISQENSYSPVVQIGLSIYTSPHLRAVILKPHANFKISLRDLNIFSYHNHETLDWFLCE